MKRDYVLNNYVYVNLRLRFEGFDDEMKSKQDEILDALSSNEMAYINMK